MIKPFMNRLLQLIPGFRSLLKENEKLRNELDELAAGKVTIYDLAVRNGRITASFGTEMAQVIADSFAKTLREARAENYIEFQFKTTATAEERLCVTVRWEKGKTPHELRLEAEYERDQLKAKVESMSVSLPPAKPI